MGLSRLLRTIVVAGLLPFSNVVREIELRLYLDAILVVVVVATGLTMRADAIRTDPAFPISDGVLDCTKSTNGVLSFVRSEVASASAGSHSTWGHRRARNSE